MPAACRRAEEGARIQHCHRVRPPDCRADRLALVAADRLWRETLVLMATRRVTRSARKRRRKDEDEDGDAATASAPSAASSCKRAKTGQGDRVQSPPMQRVLTADDVAWWRLWRSGLVAGMPGLDSDAEAGAVAEAVAGVHVAVQAQIPLACSLAVWNRMVRPAVDAVPAAKVAMAALRETMRGEGVVRTWGPRWTLHAMTVRDLALYLAARGSGHIEYLFHRAATRKDIKRIATQAEMERMVEATAARLSSQGSVSKDEFATMSLPSTAQHGVFGVIAYRGQAVRDDVGDSSTPVLRPMPAAFAAYSFEPEAAWRELLLRYFDVYGPASETDVCYWLGAKRGETAPRVSALVASGELTSVRVTSREDEEVFIRTSVLEELDALPPRAGAGDTTVVRLLGRFEPVLIAVKDKSAWIAPEHYRKVWAHTNVASVVLVNTRLVGRWKVVRRAKMLTIVITAFDAKCMCSIEQAWDEVLVQAGGLASVYGFADRASWAIQLE